MMGGDFMFIELAIGGALTFAQAWKGYSLNEKALATLRDAHNTHANAVCLIQSHKEAAEQKLTKLVNRKKAMLSVRMNQFISVYQEIRKIDFQPGDGILELYSDTLTIRQAEEIEAMAITALKPMSEKELAVAYIFSGPGGLYLADAKRSVELANSQERIADAMYQQAETIVVAMDAIGKRANQISDLLAKFGVLFSNSIREASAIIQRNGTDRKKYTQSDRETLMICINLAGAIKNILDVPILDSKGKLTSASARVLQESKRRMKEIEDVMREK